MRLGVQQLWKSLQAQKTVTKSPQNALELAKTVSVHNRHVSPPGGSLIVEIILGPKIVSNSPRNGPELAKTNSIDDRHLNAPRSSLIVEITPGPQSSEC